MKFLPAHLQLSRVLTYLLVCYLTLWASVSSSVKRGLLTHTSQDCELPSRSSTNIHFPSLLCFLLLFPLFAASLLLCWYQCFPFFSPTKPSAGNLSLEFCLESMPMSESKGFRGRLWGTDISAPAAESDIRFRSLSHHVLLYELREGCIFSWWPSFLICNLGITFLFLGL